MTTKERNAAWAAMKWDGWCVEASDYGRFRLITPTRSRCGTFATREQAIDYALKLAQEGK